MRTLRLLGRDMENGILRRCVLFILPLLFAVSQTRELHAYLIELADGNILLTNGTFADYLLFAMKGMEVYYFDPRSVFYIPIYWFAFQIGLAYFLAYYSSDDFAANARVVCLASGSPRIHHKRPVLRSLPLGKLPVDDFSYIFLHMLLYLETQVSYYQKYVLSLDHLML